MVPWYFWITVVISLRYLFSMLTMASGGNASALRREATQIRNESTVTHALAAAELQLPQAPGQQARACDLVGHVATERSPR